MEGVIIGTVIIGVVSLIIFFIVLVVMLEKKRRERWRQVAEKLNFNFAEKSSGPPEVPGIKLFTRGYSKVRKNILSGEAQGLSILICDYFFTVGSGKNSTRYSQTICLLEDPEFNLPEFFIRREHGVFDWIGEKMGGQDIDFEDDPGFSKAFVLQGTKEEKIRYIFTQSLRDMLVTRKKEFKSIEGRGHYLLLNCGRRVKAEEAHHVLDSIFTIRGELGEKAFAAQTS